MSTKEKKEKNNSGVINIPCYNIRFMSDEEWNRLAYQNYLKKRAQA